MERVISKVPHPRISGMQLSMQNSSGTWEQGLCPTSLGDAASLRLFGRRESSTELSNHAADRRSIVPNVKPATKAISALKQLMAVSKI